MAGTDLVSAVVDAVAAADGVEPGEVESLYDHMDPDVVARLGELERGEWSFTFRFSDHQVTVTHESQIFVDGVPHATDASTK
ncbi:HalOD1 output domain-containing protein [Halobaculum sp. EA56]|uniref:HalOD1 output domain-containing protein n=1 Tax=Halobaculum sp. EA56 TaxID=3421648 RepID=UPI003EBDA58F